MPLLPALGLAAVTLAVIRPLAIGLVFLRARLSRTARALMAWFGPRGLSALLLILLVVQAGLPAGDHLLAPYAWAGDVVRSWTSTRCKRAGSTLRTKAPGRPGRRMRRRVPM